MADLEGGPLEAPKPDAPLPEQYCTSCKVWIRPRDARGQCPTCGRPMLGSQLALKRKVNKARVEQLYAEAVAEYNPDTLELKDACRFLAAIKERLEAERLGSPEHQRLMTQWSDLSTRLREASSVSDDAHDAAVGALTDDQLIERLSEHLRFLLNARDIGASSTASGAGPPLMPSGRQGAAPLGTDPLAPAIPAPAPQVTCQWCHQTPCVGAEHSAFDVLHWNDPAEVKKRDEQATAVMMRMVGRPLGMPHLDSRVGPRPDPLAGLSPEDREREQKARAAREERGWECGILNEQTGRYQP